MILYRLPLMILTTSLLYIFIVPDEPLLFNLFFKVLPIGIIIYYGYHQLPRDKKVTHWLILVGLLFSSVGDATLHWFLIGLSAFFIGHVFYCLGFFSKASFTKLRTAALLPVSVYAVIFAMQLVPALQASGDHSLILPVIAYIIIISLMLWSAVLTGNIFALCGSLLFVISDSILAWNKFIDPVGFAEPLIMLSYYGGQFLIATSLYSLVKIDRRIVW
ncbi:lysoplasmalogenase [Ralstonia pickettii]|nr:lysoplasmalogenase [Ralstonia pickettii]